MPELRVVKQQLDLDDLPEVLTVEEAAGVLRIGRGTAYGLARRWRDTDGAAGLPVISLGGTLRVPRAALRRLLETDQQADHAGGR